MKSAKSAVGCVVKQIGASVLVECSEPGVWVIKTAQTIPDAELWLHQPGAGARCLDWRQRH